MFGEIKYNDRLRRLDIDITDGLNYKISPPYRRYSTMPSGLYFEKNSVNGLKIRWIARNNTNKTINYYTTFYYMLNAVGDFAFDTNGNYDLKIRTVGPVCPGECILDYTPNYEVETYNKLCRYIYLHKIMLEYNDGTSEEIYYDHIGGLEI